MQHPAIHLTTLAGLAVLVLASLSAPPGPAPLPAGGTPILGLPHTIDTPGFYYLTGNLAGDEGITINAPNVTLDLCGYTLTGPGPSDGIGIRSFNNLTKIKNGGLTNWGTCVNLWSYSAVEDMCFSFSGAGVVLDANTRVERCVFQHSGKAIEALGNTNVRDCNGVTNSLTIDLVSVELQSVVKNLQFYGGARTYVFGDGTVIENCSATGFEDVGFEVGENATLLNCYARRGPSPNTSNGMRVGAYGRLVGCVVEHCGGMGIQLGEMSIAESCRVSDCGGVGMSVGAGSRVSGCNVDACNTEGADAHGGLVCGSKCTVEGSTVRHSKGAGIRMQGEGGRVDSCFLYQNTIHGLYVNEGTVAEDNISCLNGGSGILARGARNLLRGNAANQNDYGLRALGQGTLVVGNQATQNSTADFDVSWGNPWGPYDESMSQIVVEHPQANFETPLGQ